MCWCQEDIGDTQGCHNTSRGPDLKTVQCSKTRTDRLTNRMEKNTHTLTFQCVLALIISYITVLFLNSTDYKYCANVCEHSNLGFQYQDNTHTNLGYQQHNGEHTSLGFQHQNGVHRACTYACSFKNATILTLHHTLSNYNKVQLHTNYINTAQTGSMCTLHSPSPATLPRTHQPRPPLKICITHSACYTCGTHNGTTDSSDRHNTALDTKAKKETTATKEVEPQHTRRQDTSKTQALTLQQPKKQETTPQEITTNTVKGQVSIPHPHPQIPNLWGTATYTWNMLLHRTHHELQEASAPPEPKVEKKTLGTRRQKTAPSKRRRNPHQAGFSATLRSIH